MVELDRWLKDKLEKNGVKGLYESWGNLMLGDNEFGIGTITNPYLNYKYSFWWKVDGKRGSCPLGDTYDNELLRDCLKRLLGLELDAPAVVAESDKPQKQLTLFDFM